MEACEYYKNCYAGCNANSLLNTDNGDNVACYIQKGILKEIKNYILEYKGNLEPVNANYSRILDRGNVR